MTETTPPTQPAGPSWLETYLANEPPATLYHYTDDAGLHGIVTAGQFWATNFQFFNDVTEFKHAKAIAHGEIARLLGAEKDEARRHVLAAMHKGVDYSGINSYVSSWSASDDDLSQWRAYGGARTGYQIAVSGANLAAIAKANDFVLVPCLYREEEKRAKMRELMVRSLEENVGPESPMNDEDLLPAGNLPYYLNRCACMFKDEAFAGEKEWRLISRPTSLRSPRADVRPSAGRSTLIPFYRIDARLGEPTIPIDSIKVGPCPHPEQAASAVHALMMMKQNHVIGKKPVPISNTKVPFRNW